LLSRSYSTEGHSNNKEVHEEVDKEVHEEVRKR
jgi:hypothetical protein